MNSVDEKLLKTITGSSTYKGAYNIRKNGKTIERQISENINIVTKEDGTIESWTSYPFDENKPHISIKDPFSIHLGIDKIIDGKLVRDSKTYKKTLELQEKRCKVLVLRRFL